MWTWQTWCLGSGEKQLGCSVNIWKKDVVKLQIEYALVRKRWEDRRNVPNMMGEIKVLTIYLGWEWQIIKNNSQQRINVESEFKFDNKEIEESYECLRDTHIFLSFHWEDVDCNVWDRSDAIL